MSPPEQGFNPEQASKLRPGHTLEDVKRVWGSRWEQPRTGNEGYIFGRNAGVDFSVRIDRAGRVGTVSYHGNFPVKYSIEGLQLGMPLAAMLAARPSLRLRELQDPDDTRRGVTEYVDLLPDGCELAARVHKDRLGGLTIERPGADYPRADEWTPAPPGKYPEPLSKLAAPFADTNLKLLVLSELLDLQVIDLGTAQELAMHVRGEYVDVDDELGMMTDVYDFLARYPLTDSHLDRIEVVGTGATSSIYPLLWPLWDGESQELDVKSLIGIERCVNIKEVSIFQTWTPLDLSPLAGLTKLASIEIVETMKHTHARTLLNIPSLKKIRCDPNTLDDMSVLETLRSRGVEVRG